MTVSSFQEKTNNTGTKRTTKNVHGMCVVTYSIQHWHPYCITKCTFLRTFESQFLSKVDEILQQQKNFIYEYSHTADVELVVFLWQLDAPATDGTHELERQVAFILVSPFEL